MFLPLAFILALIVLAAGIIFLKKISTWECVKNPFTCQKNPIVLRVLCLVERCIEGCFSNEVEKLSYAEFKCQDSCERIGFLDYVKNNEKKFDYSYCGLQYNIKFSKNQNKITLKIDDIKKYFSSKGQDYFKCIVIYDSSIDDVLRAETSSTVGKIYVDKEIVESYEEGKVCGPLPSGFKEASSVTFKEADIYITGAGELFYIDSPAPGSASFVDINPYLVFITPKKYYEDVKEGEIIFRLNRYRPLDDNVGALIVESSFPCGFGNALNVYWHCSSIYYNELVCPGEPKEIEMCDKYIISTSGLPSSIDFYTPIFFDLKIKK